MDPKNLSFLEPVYLKLLFVPVVLFFFWLWRFWQRRKGIARYLKARTVPLREKYLLAGQWAFWLSILLALTASILALSRPAKTLYVKDTTSIDIIVVMDGSASMRVRDLKPDRWQRSIAFLRIFAETLKWKGDRLALAVFAYRASPYIRLTDDPNVVIFFLDHLKKESPLKLYDDKTWNSNVEQGIYWGVKILVKDEELYGPSKNPAAFMLISDGSEWSGNMEEIFKIVKQVAPVYVVGVGTTVGGLIPEPKPVPPPIQVDDEGNTIPAAVVEKPEPAPVHSSIDRSSLQKIAMTTGGKPFELGTESDSQIALKIINAVQQHRISSKKEPQFQELYWFFILGAGIFLASGIFFLYK